jgi:hypothetical protein
MRPFSFGIPAGKWDCSPDSPEPAIDELLNEGIGEITKKIGFLRVVFVLSCLRGLALCLQNFVDQKQIGEQRAQVDRRIEVVDDLRADGLLREDQLNRGL